MENDLYNEINQYQKLGNKKDIPKNLIFKHYINNAKENIKLEDFDIASISTHKNSADSLNSLNAIPEKEIPFSSRLPIKNVKDKLNNISEEHFYKTELESSELPTIEELNKKSRT